MATITLPSSPPILVALNPLPPRLLPSTTRLLPPSQLSIRCFLSPRRVYKPLRCSLSDNARISPAISMASNEKSSEPLWKSLGKSIENLGKKPSVEELLRQQIENQEYYDGGGGGENRPGGGGGGGGGESFGGSEDEGFAGIIDETIQVILATLGFIFMYVYIINGAEMTRLAKDFISFLFGGRKSVRLSRALYHWERFCKNLTAKKEVDRYWLEKAIVNTPTWWDSPDKYRQILKAFLQPQSSSYGNEEQQSSSYGYEEQQSRSYVNEEPQSRSYDDEDMSEEISDEYY